MKPLIEINTRQIGKGCPIYIIAEMSANHHQDFGQAVEILRAAKEAGADAIKLQTYTPDTMTLPVRNEFFQIGQGTIWEGRQLYDLYAEAYTPWEWHPKLKEISSELGLDLFSTPFDDSSVDFLEQLGVPAYKIASFELVDLPLLRRVAGTGKPIIMSTGMATLAEIDEAMNTLKEAGSQEVALLKCTDAYPAPPAEMNLRTIPHLSAAFGVPVGLSDHSLGIVVSIAAVALGACIVEKHFTLSREVPGPDSAFSLEPQEFKEMVRAIRMTEQALGEVSYELTPQEAKSRIFRRSLFVVQDMNAGEVLTRQNLKSIRPGHGLPPKYYLALLGKRVNQDVKKGTPFAWNLLD